jgi:hypothetical protein
MTLNTIASNEKLKRVSSVPLFKSVDEVKATWPSDIATKFHLSDKISQEQEAFFGKYGFIHFKNVFTKSEVQKIKMEQDRVRAELIAQKQLKINGVPLKFGYGLNGELLIQRLPFSSKFSTYLSQQVNRPEIQTLLSLVKNGRIGEGEKDGVVSNHYVNKGGSNFKGMGWHTDGLRDIFYLQKPKLMLNVGIHLDDSPAHYGGLRLIPGTHTQSIFSTIFSKPYFVNHTPDKREIAVETEEGDLTIHDGRLWHRAQAPNPNAKGERRVIYFPILSGKIQLKDENSKTPPYLRLMKNINPFK